MNIAVYLGSNEGKNDILKEKVQELGHWIGSARHTLVYGGSKSGLMGMIADSVLEAGGKVIGVEPDFFIESEYQHDGLTQLIITKDMSERKAKMIELSDAFIAFPGGLGTLDEITEIMCLNALHRIDAPCIIYNLDGYYEHLKNMFDEMKKWGLASDKSLNLIKFVDDIDDIVEIL